MTARQLELILDAINAVLIAQGREARIEVWERGDDEMPRIYEVENEIQR